MLQLETCFSCNGEGFVETRTPCGYSWKAKADGKRMCSEDKEKFGAVCAKCGGEDWIVEPP